MKKIEMLIFITLLNIGFVIAQPPQGRGNRVSVEEWAKRTTEWMEKELNLTPDQITPIDSINLLFAKAQQAYFQTVDRGDRDKIREAMRTLEQEKITSFSEFLTPEQLELYKVKIQEVRENAGRRRNR